MRVGCYKCGSTKDLDYEIPKHRNPKDTIFVCKKCHQKYNGKKSTIIIPRGRDKEDIEKMVIGYECRMCHKFVKKISEFKEGECPDWNQHEWKPMFKSLIVKMPFWVLKDLVDEKYEWVKDAVSRGEEPPAFEKWIMEELSFAADLVDELIDAEKDLEELWNERQRMCQKRTDKE